MDDDERRLSAEAPGCLRVALVDDEPLARSRLRALLGDCADAGVRVVAEAGNARQALALLAAGDVDLALVDIEMPGDDGLVLAQALRHLGVATVFVTAHSEHALAAFELDALDYLTKPVRLERLRAALDKARRHLRLRQAETVPSADPGPCLVVHERGRTERVPLGQIVYCKAELKYLTVRTPDRHYLVEGALADLEQRYPEHFLRIHRNALVARAAVRGVQRAPTGHECADGWVVRLSGVPELLEVSRRQLGLVRHLLGHPHAGSGQAPP